MKRILAILLAGVFLLTACTNYPANSPSQETATVPESTLEDVQSVVRDASDIDFDNVEINDWSDPDSLKYIENLIYQNLIEKLDSDEYLIEKVDAVYVSQEYIDEQEFNSKSNIYFGYTEAELASMFQESKYVFTLGENGETVPKEFEDYDDTYEQVIRNVAIGTGVIVVCVVISVVTYGAGAAAISSVFAYAAAGGALAGVTAGVSSGIIAGLTEGVKTQDFDKAVKAAALAASESYMWGAIIGAATAGTSQAIALHGATLNGLTMNQAAIIQHESKYPLSVISEFHSFEEYEVFKNAGLTSKIINGETALVQANIDLNLVDEMGRTNLQRMLQGLSPLDSAGNSYELHHIGQEADGVLAVLTQEQHDNIFLHGFKKISEIDRNAFAKIRKEFWKTVGQMFQAGAIK